MNHGLTNDFLFAACKIDVHFEDDLKKSKTISGTAFFVTNSKGELCLITNRHIVDLDYKQLNSKYKNFKLIQIVVYSKKFNNNTGLPTDSQNFIIINHNELAYSTKIENDVACLKNVKVLNPFQKETIIDFHVEYAMIADRRKLDETLVVCDFVAFPGFPDWYDKKNNSPILRTGTIASYPRFDYSFSGLDDGEVIAYEAFSFDGSNCSPIFALEKGLKLGEGLTGGGHREVMLIGINAGHLPIEGVIESHSGISYFYKSSVILELIDN